MLSNRIRIQIIAAVISATALGVGAGVASPASSSERLEGVTVDQAAVARHRALGRLGEELQVVSDSAIIAPSSGVGPPAAGAGKRRDSGRDLVLVGFPGGNRCWASRWSRRASPSGLP
jgi:hypothetical protein